MRNAGYAAVWLLVLIIPLENAMVIPGIGTVGRLVGILALATGVLALFALKRPIRLHPVHGLMLFFVLLSGVSFFWSIDPEDSFQRIFTYFQLLLMMWLIFQWCDDQKKMEGLYLAFLLGSMGLAWGVIDQFRNTNVDVRIEVYNFNPNEIASILALSIPLAWYLFVGRKGPMRWMYFLMPPVAALGMLLTGSRGGLIKGLFGLAFILTTPPQVGRVRGKVILGAAVAVVGSSIFFLPDRTWDRLLTTYAELTSGSLGGRGLIWSTGMEVFSKHPVLGVGAGAFSDSMTAFFSSAYAPHNVIVALLVEQGIVGLIAFGAIALVAARSALLLTGTERRLWITVLGIWVASILTCNWEWRKQMWLLLILAVTHAEIWVGRAPEDRPLPFFPRYRV